MKEAGIDFNNLHNDGIFYVTFAKHFSMIGLASNPFLTWLGFNSMYDFAYLLSLFTILPDTVEEFLS